MAKKVVVVRIGNSTIHVVHMENTNSVPTVYNCFRLPVPDGAVRDGMILDVPRLAECLTTVLNQKKIPTRDMIFIISSSKIASRETTVPSVAKNKMPQLVMSKINDLFPVDEERYSFSYVLQGREYIDSDDALTSLPDEDEDETKAKKKSKNTGAKVQDVRVFAAPNDLIQSYYTLADAGRWNVIALEADANSIFQTMRRQVTAGVTMALQVNAESTLVNIISEDKLLLQRVVPYGTNVFTEAMIADEVFKVPDTENALKLLSSQRILMSSINADNPSNDYSVSKRIEVTNNGEALIGNIARVAEYYNNRFKQMRIDQVILVGTGCSIAGFSELLSNELGIGVVIPKAIRGIRFNRKIAIDASILQYINGFGAVFSPVNFKVDSSKTKGGSNSTVIGIACLAGLALIGVGLAAFSIFSLHKSSVDREFWKSRDDAIAPVQSEYDTLVAKEANYKIGCDVIKVIDTNGTHFHELIKKIEGLCPKSFTIKTVNQDENMVDILAESVDKLSSLPLLEMQLEKIPEIQNVKLDAIADTKQIKKTASLTKDYAYTLTFEYVPKVISPAAVNQSEGVVNQ